MKVVIADAFARYFGSDAPVDILTKSTIDISEFVKLSHEEMGERLKQGYIKAMGSKEFVSTASNR